jgi:hypothetical protein
MEDPIINIVNKVKNILKRSGQRGKEIYNMGDVRI